jgi:cytochrome c nitrite reductase small subunit
LPNSLNLDLIKERLKRKDKSLFKDVGIASKSLFTGIGGRLSKKGSRRSFCIGFAVCLLLFVLGTGAYQYSGTSGFCVLCHSMASAGNQWKASRHKQFDCVECHLPPGNPVLRFTYKTRAGIDDLAQEVSGEYPLSINLSGKGRVVANANCLRCHFSTVERTPMVRQGQECVKCHRHLVHGRGPGI